MSETLLQTKLYIPPLRPNLVPRPRLIERLNQGLEMGSKLTLVSAPAGYGKTTLITDWINSRQDRIRESHYTWLSLDEADNECPRFFSYLIAALQQIDPIIGADVPAILETGVDVPIERLLTSLVNDIVNWGGDHKASSNQLDSGPQRLILILDDYHLISEFDIHESLDFLIDHIPLCMHLVILTRVDPPMPLGRLRVQRNLLEIREVDLRFTSDEATTYLNSLMELDLSTEDIGVLEARTEGWIAALQLAALSLQGRSDKNDQISAFSGSHRHLVDYLAHEVMSRQTEEVQSFLLRTSVLERFNDSLCDAVTDLGAIPYPESTNPNLRSREILDLLEAANLFLIALDDDRQWYRYHHLFADFLDQRLREKHPGIIPDLFIRASQWYEAQGLMDEAIESAFDSGVTKRAAKLLDDYAEVLLFNAELDKVLGWAKRLPEDVRAQFPRLCIYHAWALQFEYQLDLVEPTLALAEAHLADPASLPESFSASQLAGHASAIRVYTANKMGELDRAVKLSLATLRALPMENSGEALVVRGALTLGLGMAYLDLGQLDSAYQAFQRALPLNKMAGNRYAALSSVNMLLNIAKVRGELNQAYANGEKGLLWIDEWSKTGDQWRKPARNLAYFRREIGLVQYERNELKHSADNLTRSCKYFELAQSWLRFDSYAYLVDLYQALGDMDRALEYMRKLERFSLKPDLSLPSIPIGAYLAHRYILLSQSAPYPNALFTKAARWAETLDLASSGDFLFEREYEYRILAQILIAQQKAEVAIPHLDRLIESAENGGRNGHLIAYLSLLAVALYSLGETDLALANLSRALTLGEPEGYVRTYVDLGPPMQDLLQLAAGKDFSPTYVTELLAAFPATPLPLHDVPAPKAEHRSNRLTLSMSQIEPLNDREMQILSLMSAMLSNREIAEELHLSINTVKWYARQIYEKLGVAGRRKAVGRAREMGIL